ncbi:ADP-ribosylglycohydrolase family protein, partial [Flavobacteriaceae bacterium]|nr:ADP-ribosylglycohydrolase family protein [Flavobacteriaceae bacterium]
KLPIQTTARFEAESISKFYVTMHSLASLQTEETLKNRILWMADESRKILDESTYPALMYDYTKQLYLSGIPWEQTRDSIYQRYQINQKDGYDITGQNLYCNGCFASGINFAASLVSLFYGEGNFKETIKIGTLCGWDSDNPTATWGGLIGFIIGKKGIENAFLRQFSNRFNIHRTRQNFKNDGIDTFSNMASDGLLVIDEVVTKEMGGRVNHENDVWIIPTNKTIDFKD